MKSENKNDGENMKKRIFRSDFKQKKTLVEAARLGTINAVRASRALGLDITYIKNGVLYTEKPDGSIIESPLEKTPVLDNGYELKKGMILYAKK